VRNAGLGTVPWTSGWMQGLFRRQSHEDMIMDCSGQAREGRGESEALESKSDWAQGWL
jgi:hypothetical protein